MRYSVYFGTPCPYLFLDTLPVFILGHPDCIFLRQSAHIYFGTPCPFLFWDTLLVFIFGTPCQYLFWHTLSVFILVHPGVFRVSDVSSYTVSYSTVRMCSIHTEQKGFYERKADDMKSRWWSDKSCKNVKVGNSMKTSCNYKMQINLWKEVAIMKSMAIIVVKDY